MSKRNLKDIWGNTGRAKKVLLSGALAFVLLFIFSPFLPFVLNTTISMPRGLYYTYDCVPKRGDLVQFRPDHQVWNFAVERGYVAQRAKGLFKATAALSGDRVCWRDNNLYINGEHVGSLSELDSHGRPLGHESECITVSDSYFLPLALDTGLSYDGRYFGVVPLSKVESCLQPLVVEEG